MNNLEIKIVNLKNRLKKLCSVETCSSAFKDDWSPANPFLGHCAVVSAIVCNKFGGEVMRGVIAESGMSHYFNKINGKTYDLTIEQYDDRTITLTDIQESSIARILNNEKNMQRYNILMSKLSSLPEESNDSI